ncbi:MAG: hypothetical protein HDKAJFGB_04215 [Anaerolineae bacterium]|nr:hypothetical protein [Anaerolineae bacterium]
MFTQYHSQAEMDQWHQACADAAQTAPDAPRAGAARGATAKGQGERYTAHRDAQTMSTLSTQMVDDWAGECMFDCYNG